ncbi:MAG TPA: alkaline phosphatase family protein [Thermoanaerobaculia bacterium]|nr:alkaline phosphatase family protein [Thermoanaerobaculia bacterium]
MRQRALLLILLLTVLSCRTAPPSPPRKVLMLSLDGADTITLHRLYKEGKLDAGGFARFFREGQVADALVPANPTITAPNHISLATGYPTGKTGIVANDIRLPGMPLAKKVSGFAADIDTETLWEAAHRQGLRVGVSTWPGADGRNARRSADWGLIYTNTASQKPELRTVRDWKGPLEEGEWALVPCSEGKPPGCWVKILEVLESDPPSVRLYFAGEHPLRAYPAEFEAALHRDGLIWPGPPDDDLLDETWAGRPGIDLDTWVEQTERFSTFFMDATLAAARYSEWDLLMAYTPVIDEAGHQLLLVDPRQPGFSPERAASLDAARVRVWQSVDRELARLLAAVDLRTTTVLVVSDHGMMPAHTMIDIDTLLRDWGLLALEADGKTPAPESRADSISAGGMCHIYLQPGVSGAEGLVEKLRKDLAAWSDRSGRPIIRMLTRAEAAEIEMDHPNSGDLILITEPGYIFRHEGDPVAATPLYPTDTYGMHGYLNNYPAVHASYLVIGAGIKKGNAGTFRNTEVAGRVAEWLGIEKPRERP